MKKNKWLVGVLMLVFVFWGSLTLKAQSLQNPELINQDFKATQALVDSIRKAVYDSLRRDMMRMHNKMHSQMEEAAKQQEESEARNGEEETQTTGRQNFFRWMSQTMGTRGHLSNMRRFFQPEPTGPMKEWGAYLYANFLRTPPDANGKRNFNNHNLSIELSGKGGQRFHYLAEFGLQHSGEFTSQNELEIEKAYIGYELNKAFTAWSGMFLIPFNRFNVYHEPPNHRLVTTPLITRLLGAVDWNDAGLMFYGRIDVRENRSISYFLYAVNGKAEAPNLEEGINVDNNDNPAYGGRIAFAPDRGSDIAVSYYSSKYDRRSRFDLRMLGFDARYERGDFHLYGEFARADIETPTGYANGEAWGYFAQISQRFNKIFVPTLRYGRAKYNDPYHGEGFDPIAGTPGNGIYFDGSRLSLGLTLYPTESIGLKFEYDINWRDGSRVPDNTIAIQIVSVFE